jgi:hypothetical protein
MSIHTKDLIKIYNSLLPYDNEPYQNLLKPIPNIYYPMLGLKKKKEMEKENDIENDIFLIKNILLEVNKKLDKIK